MAPTVIIIQLLLPSSYDYAPVVAPAAPEEPVVAFVLPLLIVLELLRCELSPRRSPFSDVLAKHEAFDYYG